ncbi:MAG TPA: GlsB/YeaQ/YmgE family stress response membrane protein [Propionicimonas sp.]|jgi:uncharacterized membrane protein YeaQ/YmgE (transglycosylase-associated protein family)|nr:GlsB/YeaQ/YmgE family stress response membrane protein [Propionicimonas sp.]
MNFIAWIVMGLIAGTIAKAILKSSGGWVTSLVIGVVGALVGGWIGATFLGHDISGFFSLWSWGLAIGGSVLVLWIYGLIVGRRR